jgi:hypothetical protein
VALLEVEFRHLLGNDADTAARVAPTRTGAHDLLAPTPQPKLNSTDGWRSLAIRRCRQTPA